VKIIQNHPKKHKKVLERFWIYNSKFLGTPVEVGLALSLDQRPKTDDEIETMNYASVVGSLM